MSPRNPPRPWCFPHSSGSPGQRSLRSQLTIGACTIAAAQLAWAQAAPAESTAPAGSPPTAAAASAASAAPVKFAIRGFQVKGENPLPGAETTLVLAKFLRQDADIEVLQQATTALETRLRERGFGLHRVALPPQEIGETVTLEIIRFTISKVNFEREAIAAPSAPTAPASSATPSEATAATHAATTAPAPAAKIHYDDANIARSLPELKAGTTPNFKRLAVQTALANDAAAKQVSVSLKESDQPDQIEATVRVREQRPWWASVSVSNTGSPSSGNDRLTLSAAHSNVFNRDHQASLSLTTSAEAHKAVQQYGLNYRLPLYAWGGVLGASATKSNVVGNFGTFSSTGAGATWGVNYTQHLPAEGGHRGFINVSFDNKRFDVAEINGIALPGQQMRRSQALTLGYSARNESDARNISYSVDWSGNVAGSSGNDLASYQTEDPRLSTVRWQVLRVNMNLLAPLFQRKWLISLRSQLQYTPHALISGEQFGIGGSGSVRGTSERPISGDKGVSFSTELTSPELWTGMRAHAFIDGGYLTNVISNNATKLDADHLASAGVGLRFGHASGVSVSAEYGRIIKGSKVDVSVNTASPQRGHEKIHLNASFRF